MSWEGHSFLHALSHIIITFRLDSFFVEFTGFLSHFFAMLLDFPLNFVLGLETPPLRWLAFALVRKFHHSVINELSKYNKCMHRFKIQQQIGSGAYSIVYRATDLETGAPVAIKKIHISSPEIKMVLHREIRILQKVNHQNIIKLLGVYNDLNHGYLVFEYLPFDLISYYKKVREKKNRNLGDSEITYIMYQIGQALSHMHGLGIMHRDIKPQNILINPKTLEIKLIDFGFATECTPSGKNTQYMVTRWYRPLEIVLGLPYDTKIDVFSLGALMLELYLGQQIFRSSSNIDQLYWIIDVCGYPSWSPAIERMRRLGISAKALQEPTILRLTSNLRQQAQQIIMGMLHTNPCSRLSISQFLWHPYFSRYAKVHTAQDYPRNRVHTQKGQSLSKYHLGLQNSVQRMSREKYPQILTDRGKDPHYNSQPYLIGRKRASKYDLKTNENSMRSTRFNTQNPVKTEYSEPSSINYGHIRKRVSAEKGKSHNSSLTQNGTTNSSGSLLLKKNLTALNPQSRQRPKQKEYQNNSFSQKGPLFSKIRGKLIPQNSTEQRIKISLTDRNPVMVRNPNSQSITHRN